MSSGAGVGDTSSLKKGVKWKRAESLADATTQLETLLQKTADDMSQALEEVRSVKSVIEARLDEDKSMRGHIDLFRRRGLLVCLVALSDNGSERSDDEQKTLHAEAGALWSELKLPAVT